MHVLKVISWWWYGTCWVYFGDVMVHGLWDIFWYMVEAYHEWYDTCLRYIDYGCWHMFGTWFRCISWWGYGVCLVMLVHDETQFGDVMVHGLMHGWGTYLDDDMVHCYRHLLVILVHALVLCWGTSLLISYDTWYMRWFRHIMTDMVYGWDTYHDTWFMVHGWWYVTCLRHDMIHGWYMV
jgi:hypothetical protein